MSSFISKKKQKTTSNHIKEGVIIIPDINIVDLDKKYGMKDITDSVFKKMIKKQSSNIKISENNDTIIQHSDELISLEKDDDTIIIFDDDSSENITDCQMNHGSIKSINEESLIGTDSFTNIEKSKDHEQQNKNCLHDINIPLVSAPSNRKLLNSYKGTLPVESGSPVIRGKSIPDVTTSNSSDNPEKKLNLLKNKIENFLKEPPKVFFKKSNSLETQIDRDLTGEHKIFSSSLERNSMLSKEVSPIEENKVLVKKKLFKQLSTKEDLDIKNVVTKLENIGISEQKAFNYNTLVKNESIICNSYNCMNDINSQKILSIHDINKNGINIHCWWCRHSIPEHIYPIGCPIKYHSGSNSDKEEYFDTEGIFCSFNCVISYNNDVSQNNIRYRETGGLIYLLYKKLFGIYPYQMNIKPALSWKVLKNYGGDMTIQEYRSTFQKLDNISQNFVGSFNSVMKSSSAIFVEEKSNVKLNQSEF